MRRCIASPGRGSQRRASGLVRTLVVASATLAILLVCFSMYQYSQLRPESAAPVRGPRLPLPPSEPSTDDRTSLPAAGPGVPMGQGVIGPGQNITVTIYPREGTRARFELSVSDWIPKDGSDHEFVLTDPQVRMRTKDGNDVRIRARRGVMEAQRKSGGGLDPNRGELTGEVVIEYDRRSEKDKALLPEALRNQIDPSELVRIEADRMEFDLEYSKLVVPGAIHVAARDLELRAEELEIRFNEAQGRVESLRIARGGRLDLLERGAQLGVNLPGGDRRGGQKSTLADWLRTTIQSRLDAQAQAAPAAPKPPGAAPGVPVFHADAEKDAPGPPVRYFARFEGNVDAKQFAGDATRSRLQADVLEILREFSDQDKNRVRSSASPTQAAPTEQPVAPTGDRIVLEWTGKLVVDALSRGDERWTDDARSRVTAVGAPARLSHPEGDAMCSRLTYEPDGSEVQLFGSEAAPVAVRSADQGAMTGLSASLRRRGNALDIQVMGPGRLTGALSPTAKASAAPLSGPKSESFIEFGKELTAQGRFVTKTTVDFTGSVATREHRVLDRASFSGRAAMQEADTRMEADSIDLGFAAQPAGRGERQAVERMVGRGDVVMTQGTDRITCREIDVGLGTDADGRSQPRTATATGDVAAAQGERTLHAKDKLVVDFDRIAGDGKTGETRTRTGVSRLRAFGAVRVFDPVQKLDVSAEDLDCSVVKGREIEKALVTGPPDGPATVRLDTFTVTGHRITLDVPNQWADVPGQGRLSFLSGKDLDGRKVSNLIPIVVTWADSMKYRGRENRATFNGQVHATSESTSTFDSDQLLVEFDEAPRPKIAERQASGSRQGTWGILQPFVNGAMGKEKPSDMRLGGGAFAKEPAYILAEGHAVAEMSEMDPKSGVLATRSRIAGPRLSVNLRSDVSKMLIEAPGTLQLEDFRPGSPSHDAAPRTGSDLFALDKDTGPSKTLIEWHDRMWYDFSVAQARFEGRVQLKHFSGAALSRLFEGSNSATNQPPGRSTFLACDVLIADFLDRDSRKDAADKRMGRLSSDRLRQFQASGSVSLQDQVEGLSVTADSVVYERPRQLLAIAGSRQRKAQIITQKPGRLPNQVATERLFYNLATGKLEMLQTTVKGQ